MVATLVADKSSVNYPKKAIKKAITEKLPVVVLTCIKQVQQKK